ncbi:MAG TPA: transglycosylase domain-containing protein [Rhodothermales bacterium]|nr:transglycosylase domain-containing protein [Rhodothermales bacterium]HRR07366.1 transglycosylase domain-containing protein [Rhodothermales bacterium]
MWGSSPTEYTQDELRRYFNDPERRHLGSEARQKERIQQLALLGVASVAGFIAFCSLIVTIFMIFMVNDLPSLDDLQNPKINLASIVYSQDGKEMARYIKANRKWVELESVSPYVRKALIATEDKRFFDHWGIDLQSTLSLPFKWAQGKSQGGSTITQQLARNMYEEIGRAKTFTRKLKEMMTAIELERNYTKDEIIELYLNTTAYMYDAHGIEAAASTYFNKSQKDLSLAESALLVGMLQNPFLYNPAREDRLEICTRRRNTVLDLMVEQGFIKPDEAATAKEETIQVNIQRITPQSNFAPYFAEYVRQWLDEWSKDKGYNIYTDGLRIITTLDSQMQEAAEQASDKQGTFLQGIANSEHPKSRFENSRDLTEFIKESQHYRTFKKQFGEEGALEKLRKDTAFMDSLKTTKTRIELGLIAIDPNNGFIRAWVGGRDFSIDQYDHVAIAKRQPGSTFKPFVYATAWENGFGLDYKFIDAAVTLNCEGAGRWQPKNSGSRGSGAYVPLKSALIKSLNTVTAQLACKVGSRKFVKYAQDLGVNESYKKVIPSPAMALGTGEVTLLEMAQAYTSFASGGILHLATPIKQIQDRYGNVIADFYPTYREVLNPNTAYTVVDVLRGVISQGTAKSLRGSFGISGNYDIAGKTGTTQEASDGWFMMMHPDVVLGSWVGFNDRRVTLSGSWGQGARTGMRVVGDYFKRLIDEQLVSTRKFTKPQNYKPPKNTVKQVYNSYGAKGFWKPRPKNQNNAKNKPNAGSEGQRFTPPPAPPAEERRFDW